MYKKSKEIAQSAQISPNLSTAGPIFKYSKDFGHNNIAHVHLANKRSKLNVQVIMYMSVRMGGTVYI